MNERMPPWNNSPNGQPVLVVDLDGTLTPTDTLIESLLHLIKISPLSLFQIPFWLLGNRASFKSKVAEKSGFSAKSLPLNQPFLEFLTDQKQAGRLIILATAAHRSIAESVAARVKLFDGVLASDERVNLKGIEKLNLILEKVGKKFVYAGDSKADLPIWKAAQAAILVGASARITRLAKIQTPIEAEFKRKRPGILVWVKALRIHQWMKNLLLFVPILTAFSFLDIRTLGVGALAFFSFSLAASATYMLNDLWDLNSDRAHPRKCKRPFASGIISIPTGLGAAIGIMIVGLSLAAIISIPFLLMLGLYVILTTIYSLSLKQYVVMDVLVLSLLFTLRIISGSVAVGIPTSSWLLAFSVFIFLSLALVKRCSELISLGQAGKDAAHGRDYRVDDLIVLWPLGVGAALSAVVVFGLFISAPETVERYKSTHILWLVAVSMIYWLARLWIKTGRGEMHDDPIVYAVKDFGSRMTVLAMIVLTLIAHFVHLG